MSEGERDNAGVIAPPPLIYLIAFFAAWAVERKFHHHFPILPDESGQWLGYILIAAGLIASGVAFLQFMRARTAVIPYWPATQVVSTGVYRFTRNPMYVGATLMYVGGAFVINSFWPLLLLPLVLALMQRGVIYREEAYLERKFGAEYLAYKERVRRWL